MPCISYRNEASTAVAMLPEPSAPLDQAGTAAGPAQQPAQAGAAAGPAQQLDQGPAGGNWPGRYKWVGGDGTVYRIGIPRTDEGGRYVD